jgi:hypothetical protein
MTPTKDENDLRECEGGREGSFFFSQQLLGSKHFLSFLTLGSAESGMGVGG